MTDYLNNIPRQARRRKVWTEEDDRILMARFQNDYLSDIARDLGCDLSCVNRHARKLGLYKDNPYARNHEAREILKDEYLNLTYGEIAKRTGLTKNGVWKIAQSLGLRHTKEQRNRKLSKAISEVYRKERSRVTFGFDQKTNLKVVSNRKKNMLRHRMKEYGYIVTGRGDNVLYYTDSLARSPEREERGARLGLRFRPLPVESTEELTEQRVPTSLLDWPSRDGRRQ